MQAVSVIAFFLLSIAAGPCSACGLPPNYQPQDFVQRMKQVPIAFRGRVTDTEVYHRGWGEQRLYKATFDVDCVYKSPDGTPVDNPVTVSGFGYQMFACASNEVVEGGNYIILATEDLHVYPVNKQTGVATATESLLENANKEFPNTCSQSA